MREGEALSLGRYWRETRQPAFNVLLVVFLLGVYEAGLVLSGSLRRNAADFLLKDALSRLGPTGVLAFHTALLGLALVAVLHHLRRDRPLLRYALPFCFEAALYAGLLAPAVLWLRRPFLAPQAGGTDYLLDLGAGVYEELIFRFLLIRGSLFLLHLDPWRVFELGDRATLRDYLRLLAPLVVIIVGSSLLFAAYHHWGAHGEPWVLGPFLFRTLAGLILAAIYFARGLAMAVYTHAFYDLLVHWLSGA